MIDLDKFFSAVTSKILNYEDGDVMTLSLLDDQFEKLKKDPISEYFTGLIEDILLIIRSAMKNTLKEDFSSQITGKIDILQKQIKDSKKTEADKSTDNPENASDQKNFITDDLIRNFIVEAQDRIAQAQELILQLEDSPENMDLIQSLFRIFHTIKGECGFLKIATFGELAHNIENILDQLRNQKLSLTSEVIDRFLEGVDLSKEIIEGLKKNEVVLISKLSLDSYIEKLNRIKPGLKPSLGDVLVNEGKMTEDEVEKILDEQKKTAYTRKFGELAVENQMISENDLKTGLEAQKELETREEPVRKAEKQDQIIKVKASKVNYLVDMIGELLIAIGQVSDQSAAMIQTRKITKMLQYAGMQLRTENVKNLFGNVKRVVRDVSKKLDKPVNVDVFGEDLEIDRNLIEKLEEPMIHLVRNAVHHGIESAAERIAHNKPPEGKVTISAERRGNNIIISIMDDGQGLNRDKIVAKALEKGLIKEENLSGMTDNQIYNMIFLSGFSTAEKVDYVSGRGVGMDIVKSVVTANKGKIDIQTEKGLFSRFMLIFPLSTAIIDGMIVKLEDSIFIVPISSIVESLKLQPENFYTVNSIRVFKIRDEVLPVIDLKSLFKISGRSGKNNIGIVVESSVGKKYIMIVDEIVSKNEVVIKSLGRKFRDLKGISSGSVLAGGKIGLVIDVDQVIELNNGAGV